MEVPDSSILSNSLLRNLKGKLPSESDGRIQRQYYTSKSYGKDTKVSQNENSESDGKDRKAKLCF